MRFPKLLLSIQQLMLLVALAALVATAPRIVHRHTWWEIKPFLNLAFLPAIVVILSLPGDRGTLTWLAFAGNVVLLIFWFLALRPYPGTILIGQWTEDSVLITSKYFHEMYYPNYYPFSRFARWTAYFYYRSGGTADLAFLTVTLALLRVLCFRSIPRSIRLDLAILLLAVRFVDWAVMPRVRPYEPSAWLDRWATPLRLFQTLVAGLRTPAEFWSDFGRVRPLEFLALALIFVYLAGTTIHLLSKACRGRPAGVGFGPSPGRQASTPRSPILLITLLGLASVGWFAIVAHEARRLRPTADAQTLPGFLAVMRKPNQLMISGAGDGQYLVVFGRLPALVTMPHGPPVYVFNRDGKLRHWTLDNRDEPGFFHFNFMQLPSRLVGESEAVAWIHVPR